jgi:agarase
MHRIKQWITLVATPVLMIALPCLAAAQANGSSQAPHAGKAFSVREVSGKWTLIDPSGRPFYSVGIDTVTASGSADRSGKNAYRDTLKAKYGTDGAWADAQRKRFDEWGVNTIGAFSDEELFASRNIPFTVIISTFNMDMDLWDPAWEHKMQALIAETTKRYADNQNLIAYFTDNEISWLIDLQALYFPGREILVMGEYLHKPHGREVLVAFLRKRYKTPADVSADFPDAKLPGSDWDSIQWSDAHLGNKATAKGKQGLLDWAAVMAVQYFSVTAPALRSGDPVHLYLGTKFVAGLTPSNILKVAAKYSDVISVDFYDASVSQPPAGSKASGGDKQPDFMSVLPSLLPVDQLVPNSNMLAEWHRVADKPILIAEFGYRGNDSGLPNTIPPAVKTFPTQKLRAQAVANFASCSINAPHIIGFHFFELLDEPAAGRFDGENSNWGILNENDVPYADVANALTNANRLAAHRLDSNYTPAPCTPIGFDLSQTNKH